MKLVLITMLLFLGASTFAGEGWITNFEEAKMKAAKENKSLLVDFTGSDWCGYCIRLHKSVFSTPEFKEYAKDKFVLVELDFPRKKKLPDELKAQNSKLAKQFAVQGYPTVLLMDAKGRPYAKTGYRPGGPVEYNKHLDAFLAKKAKYDELYKNAQGKSGEAKAKALYGALSSINELLLPHYSAEIAEIKKLDPSDKTGFIKAQELKAAIRVLGQTITGFAKKQDSESGNKAIEKFLTDHKPEGQMKQSVLFYKIYFVGQPKTKADLDRTEALMDEIIAIKPDSQVAAQCNRVKKQVTIFRGKIK